jgi:Cft2 family RNA processing exonuclease
LNFVDFSQRIDCLIIPITYRERKIRQRRWNERSFI